MMHEENNRFENEQQERALEPSMSLGEEPQEVSSVEIELAEETPAEETPAEEIPAEETPAEEIPAEETPAEETPAEEIPAEETPAEETPAEETPAEETPAEETPAEETPAEETPAEETPAEETPAEETPAEETPAEETPAEEGEVGIFSKPLPYHERYYLRYREGKRSVPLDLDGTKDFLQGIGFDGGELRQAREGKDWAEIFRNAGRNKGKTICSYCRTEIAGVDYYRLPDGRTRCTSCSNSLVKTKAEIEELCGRVITNLDNFFGATIDVPISIEVVEERKLKRRLGIPLGTQDSDSVLILGVAINKKKKYSIILENGAPRISLIATFAHELTHIWQYTHWDVKKELKKCPKDKRLLIYEGMAKWVEIQYLYLIGETAVAKREEFFTRRRQDEYGIGFCLYEDKYPLSREAMMCEETPFITDSYPID